MVKEMGSQALGGPLSAYLSYLWDGRGWVREAKNVGMAMNSQWKGTFLGGEQAHDRECMGLKAEWHELFMRAWIVNIKDSALPPTQGT